jgi:hypothetical protein
MHIYLGGWVGGCVCVQAARLVDPNCLYAYFCTSKASKLSTCHVHVGVDVPPNTAAAQSDLQGTQFTCFTGTKVQILTLMRLLQDALYRFLTHRLDCPAAPHFCDSRDEVLSLLALLVQKYKH